MGSLSMGEESKMEDDGGEAWTHLGRYNLQEGRRILNELEKSELDFEAEFDDGSGAHHMDGYFSSYGTSAGVDVYVSPAQASEAYVIHTKLFGSVLPSVPADSALAESWHDETTLGQIDKRENLAQELGELERVSKRLLEEMIAVKSELEQGLVSPKRHQTLESAQEKNANQMRELLAKQKQVKESLAQLGAF